MVVAQHAGLRLWATEGSGGYAPALSRILLSMSSWWVEFDRLVRPARRAGTKSDPIDVVRPQLSKRWLALVLLSRVPVRSELRSRSCPPRDGPLGVGSLASARCRQTQPRQGSRVEARASSLPWYRNPAKKGRPTGISSQALPVVSRFLPG